MAADEPALTWYPWHWKDWRSNRKVQRMTVTERGIYRELLDECWVEGSIPSDLQSLADIVGCDLPTIEAAWARVAPCFTEATVNGRQRLFNPRLTTVRQGQRSAYIKRVQDARVAGLASGDKRKKGNGRSTVVQPSLNGSQPIEKSRVETTLTTRTVAGPNGPPPPSSGKRIAGPVGPVIHPDPLAPLNADPPTPEQVAALRAVTDALRRPQMPPAS